MIEKLDIEPTQSVATNHCIINKINELVDVVNEFEKDREEIKEWIAILADLRSRVPVVESRVAILEEHAHPTAKVDPYTEQRKWIGYIVAFECGVTTGYGILTDIEPDEEYPFVVEDGAFVTKEIWLPDDGIIYKKEQ